MTTPPETGRPAEAAAAADPAREGVEVSVHRWVAGASTDTVDRVAQELPVELSYHSVPHVVMLATPADLTDFAYGFTVSEELVASADEIRAVEVVPGEDSVQVRVSIAWERFPELLRRRRNLTGRTGCGLCGTETLEQAVREHPELRSELQVSSAELHAMIIALESRQPLNDRTGSVHAAAWVEPGKGIQVVREDVGRHNALDKTIGALLRARTDLRAGYMLVTSRASYEMVQKTAAVGIGMLAALSAPTSFAIRHAQRSGLTLVAFARRDKHVVYTHARRLID